MKKRLKLWVKITIAIILLITLICLYGFFVNSKGFKVKEIALYENITEKYNGLKIVHFSDLYYGNNVKEKELKKIVKQINLIKPDLVVFTGDLIYKKNNSSLEYLKKELSKIDTEIGKYYTRGDNDSDESIQILNDSHFVNLDDTYNLIYKDQTPILIAGINNDNNIDEIKTYLNENNVFSILLTHKPSLLDKIDYSKFNLVLAGHTQGGIVQIPFLGGIILQRDNYLYGKNQYKKNDTNLFISNGLGNSDVNFRLLNKPSFNFYRIRKK